MKMFKNDELLSKNRETPMKFWRLLIIQFQQLQKGELQKWAFECCGLLYEFPAETRLTVYRRLDMPNRSVLKRPAPAKIYDVGREYFDLIDTLYLSY